MATKLFSRLTDVRGIPSAGQTNPVRVNIPTIGRLLNLKGNVIQDGAAAPLAVMKTAIDEMRLLLGSEVVRKWRFAEYLAVLEANGYVNENGFFPVYLAEPWRAQVLDEELLSLQLGGRYQQAALEFDVTQPANNPLSFDFGYEYDLQPKVTNDGKPIYGILGHTTQVEDLSGGEPVIKLNDFDGGLQRLHIVIPATARIDRVRVFQGDNSIYDRYNTAARPEIARSLKDMGMAMPADFTTAQGTFKAIPVIFDNNQRLSNSISEKTGLKLQLTLSASVQMRILIEHRINR